MADPLDFDAFYLSCRDRLALQVAGFTGDGVEALDHVQEAFIQAWLRWDKVSGYDDPEAWVRRVACNRAVSRWRRARRLVLRATPEEWLHLDREQHAVIDALAGLNVKEREAIVLHHLVGYSVQEVAEQMHVPAGTVKSWLSRGRGRLAEVLRADEEVVGREQ
ncbi:MAG: sigma-70 family RNA polymerase sigma factor [Jatrophihabitantaceae bacterium]